LPLEEAGEVRLIDEPSPQRNIGECRLGRIEEAACSLQPDRHQILMRRCSNGLLERSREM